MKVGLTFNVFFVICVLFFSSSLFGQNNTSSIVVSQEVEELIERKIEINKEVFASQYYAIQLYYGNYTAANNILNNFKLSFP